MADGSVVFKTRLDNKKAISDLQKLAGKIEDAEKKLNEKRAKKSAIEVELNDAKQEARKTEAAISKLRLEISKLEEAGSLAGIKHPIGLDEAKKSLSDQEKILKTQNKEAEMLGRQYAKVHDEIEGMEYSLATAKNKAGKLQSEIDKPASASEKIAGLFDSAGDSVGKFGKRLIQLAASAFVFNVISSGMQKVSGYIRQMLSTTEEYNNQIAKLRGALMTAFQPIYEYVLPGLLAVLRVLTAIVQVIATFTSALFGKTAAESAKNAKALNKQATAIGSVGSAAKEASKSIASFDEINQLSNDSQSGGGAGGASGIEPDFSAFDTGEYTGKVDELMIYLSGALLAIGAILTFSGANIPLGLGLMIAGAVGLAAVAYENWEAISNALQGPLGYIMAALGAVLLVLGAILTFSGAAIPLGIGLMIAGAAGLAPAVMVNWETIKGFISKNIGVIMGILGAALLVLGAILTFSGASLPLGIGLLIAGATVLASTIAVNWHEVKGFVEENIDTIVTVVGAALLALGAILAFSGANIPLGIGLLISGATVLASAIAVNWDSVSKALEGPIGKITAVVSAALLVLGIILTCTGVFPLGIGLIAAGAIGLAASVAANWNSIVSALQGPIGRVAALASGALLVLGIILTCVGIFPLGIGLIAAGAVGLVSIAALNWDAILKKLKEVWQGIQDWWDTSVKKFFTADYWKGLGKDIIDGLLSGLKSIWQSVANWVSDKASWIGNMFSDAKSKASGTSGGYSSGGRNRVSMESMASTFSMQSVPALARGAVIPPNREFLAVLGDQRHGTNIEAPLETIQEAVALVMNDFIDSNMAGHEATVGVLREILAAVLGIEIGDEVIAQAVNRYNRKMAVVNGGGV